MGCGCSGGRAGRSARGVPRTSGDFGATVAGGYSTPGPVVPPIEPMLVVSLFDAAAVAAGPPPDAAYVVTTDAQAAYFGDHVSAMQWQSEQGAGKLRRVKHAAPA